MAHFVITDGDVTRTVSAWSERDAIEEFFVKTDQDWPGPHDALVDSIRPATVREAMIAEYGEGWTKEDYRSGISHVATFFAGSYRTDYKDLLIVNHTTSQDVYGYDDPVTVANYRVLYDRWSHLEGLTRGPWSNCDVIALEVDSEAPEDLTEVLNGLSDYPVVDEQEWSNVEQEMIQEHWESYGKSDVVREVEKAIGGELTDAAEEIVTQLVWDGILDYGCGGGYPTMLDASMCDFGYEDVAKFFAEHIGTVVTVKSRNGYGDSVTFDLREGNIFA